MFQLLVLILLHLFQCRAHCTSAVLHLPSARVGLQLHFTVLYHHLSHQQNICHPSATPPHPPPAHPTHPAPPLHTTPPTPPTHPTAPPPHTPPPHHDQPTHPHPTPTPTPPTIPKIPCLPTISDPQSLHLTKISALIILPGLPTIRHLFYSRASPLLLLSPISKPTPFGAKPSNNPQPKAYAYASPPSHPQPSRLPPPYPTPHLFGAQLHFASAVVHSSSAVALIQCR